MTKYGPFRMLQIMHILHRDENEKYYLCRESRWEKGIRKYIKKILLTQCICFMARFIYGYNGHGECRLYMPDAENLRGIVFINAIA